MADLSKLKLPDNSEYDLKDATARSGLANKQDTLVSGTNIKTINNESLLGSGNITIQGGGDSLPSQTGHSGDVLSTDGSDPYWMDTESVSAVDVVTSIDSSSTDNMIPSAKAVYDAIDSIPTDDHKWAGVELGASGANIAIDSYVPSKDSMGNTSGTASWARVTSTPQNYCIAKYDGDKYLYSTTPSVNDSTTKVATTGFVQTAISNIDALPAQSSSTNGKVLTSVYNSQTSVASASWADLPEEIYFCRSNTTLTEATTAVNAGKMLIYYDSTADIYAPMIRAWLQMVQFSAIEPNDPHKLHIFTLNSSGWSTETVDVEEIFIAIYNTTSYADIDAAVTAGKLVVARNGNLSALLVEKNSNTGTYYFRGVGTGSDNIITRFQIASNSTWASTDTTLVTTSRKINNKALSSDITLTASDIGALPDSTTIPSPADATPLVDGTATVGTSTDYAREDHVHPTDTSRAPTSHASSATTYGTGTSSNYGHVKLSDSTSSTSGTSDGIAATPSAVRTAYNLANQKVSKTASAGGGDAHSLIDNTYSYIRLGVHVEQDDEHNTLELTSTTTTIHNVVTPTANGDAANKQYVDNAVAGSGLPSQTGNSGKYLTTNGTAASWGAAATVTTLTVDGSPVLNSTNLITSGGVYTALQSVDSLPSQTGNNGKYLTTNGSVASWATITDKIYICEYGVTTTAQLEAAYQAGKLCIMPLTTAVMDGSTTACAVGEIYILTYRKSATEHRFTTIIPWSSNEKFTFASLWCNNDTWSIGYYDKDPFTVASTSAAGIVQLSSSTSSTSTSYAATASAVKSAYDRAATLTGRTVAPTSADTGYTTLKTRGEKLLDATTYDAVSSWSSELVNGAIAWRYE